MGVGEVQKMKATIVVLVVVLVALLGAVRAAQESGGDAAIREQFDAFVRRYGKSYASADEAEQRLAIFTQNLAKAAALNIKYEGKTQFGITKFADMSQEEFQSRVLMSNPPPPPTEKPYRGPKFEGFTALLPSIGATSRAS